MKINRILQYLLCYLQVRISFLRPRNLTISGTTKISLSSFLIFDKESEITLHNVKIVKSKIILIKSKININNGFFDKSQLNFKNSDIDFKEKALIINSLFVSINSVVLLGSYNKIGHDRTSECLINLNGCNFRSGENVNLKCIIKAKNSSLILGDNVFINEKTEIRCENKIQIGNNVFISYNCDIFDTNTHSTNYMDRRKEIELGFPYNTIQNDEILPSTKPIYIGNDVWIGKKAAILKGSNVGDKAIIALGTIVTGSIPQNSIAYGNPFKIKTK